MQKSIDVKAYLAGYNWKIARRRKSGKEELEDQKIRRRRLWLIGMLAALGGGAAGLHGFTKWWENKALEAYDPADLPDLPKPATNAPTGSSKAWQAITAGIQRLREQKPDVRIATGLHRVAIPDPGITEKQLKAMGFIPSLIAIPERGQKSWMTYRHPTTNYHLHKHKDKWFLHRDVFAPLQFALAQTKGQPIKERAKAVATGLSHLIQEGVPGLYSMLRSVWQKAPTFSETINIPEQTRSAHIGFVKALKEL